MAQALRAAQHTDQAREAEEQDETKTSPQQHEEPVKSKSTFVPEKGRLIPLATPIYTTRPDRPPDTYSIHALDEAAKESTAALRRANEEARRDARRAREGTSNFGERIHSENF